MPYNSVLGINSDNGRAKAIVKLHFLARIAGKTQWSSAAIFSAFAFFGYITTRGGGTERGGGGRRRLSDLLSREFHRDQVSGMEATSDIKATH